MFACHGEDDCQLPVSCQPARPGVCGPFHLVSSVTQLITRFRSRVEACSLPLVGPAVGRCERWVPRSALSGAALPGVRTGWSPASPNPECPPLQPLDGAEAGGGEEGLLFSQAEGTGLEKPKEEVDHEEVGEFNARVTRSRTQSPAQAAPRPPAPACSADPLSFRAHLLILCRSY